MATEKCEKEVKECVGAIKNMWKKVSVLTCKKRVSRRMKGKLIKAAVRSAMLGGLMAEALNKREECRAEGCKDKNV